MKLQRMLSLSVGIGITLTTFLAPPAMAGPGRMSAQDALSAVDKVAAAAGSPTIKVNSTSESSHRGVNVTPRDTRTAPASKVDGRIVRVHASKPLATVVSDIGSSGRRFEAVMLDAKAPSEQAYDIALPAGATLKADPIGGVMIMKDGVPISRISAPWAYDAGGSDLPTYYEIAGATLIQHTNASGAKFPVVADPTWVWDWAKTGLYLNRKETKSVQYVGAMAAFAAAFIVPGPIGWVSAGVLTQISLQAAQADNKKKCIYITPPIGIAYIYSKSQNSFCK